MKKSFYLNFFFSVFGKAKKIFVVHINEIFVCFSEAILPKYKSWPGDTRRLTAIRKRKFAEGTC